MKPCPFCGAELDSEAIFCPYCMKTLIEKTSLGAQKRLRKRIIVLISVIVALIVAVAVAVFFPRPQSQPTSNVSRKTTTLPAVRPVMTTSTIGAVVTTLTTNDATSSPTLSDRPTTSVSVSENESTLSPTSTLSTLGVETTSKTDQTPSSTDRINTTVQTTTTSLLKETTTTRKQATTTTTTTQKAPTIISTTGTTRSSATQTTATMAQATTTTTKKLTTTTTTTTTTTQKAPIVISTTGATRSSAIQTTTTTAQAATTTTVASSQLYYTIAGGEVTITGAPSNVDRLVIPSVIEGYPVTAISEGAFKNRFIDSITFPNSLKTIGNEAFYESWGFASITIPKNVAHIGIGAFYSCDGLRKIYFNATNCSSSPRAFEDCQLDLVAFAPGISHIPDSLIYDSPSVRAFYIPKSVSTIPEYVYSGDCGTFSVYYEGSEADRQNLQLGKYHKFALNGLWTYNRNYGQYVS